MQDGKRSKKYRPGRCEAGYGRPGGKLLNWHLTFQILAESPQLLQSIRKNSDQLRSNSDPLISQIDSGHERFPQPQGVREPAHGCGGATRRAWEDG